MSELVLVRHGQANSHATNEAEYDRLSPLGHRQSAWLGEWLELHEPAFDHVYSGTLRRHEETARGIGCVDVQRDARLNELDYFHLGRALEDVHGVPFPEADGFADHAPQVMRAWHAAEIEGAETFASFEARVRDALAAIAAKGGRSLVVTSGGVIAMAMRLVLDLDATRFARVLLPIRNSSIHRIHLQGGDMMLAAFNATPHLDLHERAEARTCY